MQNARKFAVVAVIHDKFYICGGYDGSTHLNSVECFDPQTGVWSYMSPMPGHRSASAIVTDGSSLIVLGGLDGKENSSSVWKMDVNDQNSRWSELPSMENAHSEFTAAKMGDEITVVGGYSAVGKSSDIVEVFDGNTWRAGTSLNCDAAAFAAVQLNEEQSENIMKQLNSRSGQFCRTQ